MDSSGWRQLVMARGRRFCSRTVCVWSAVVEGACPSRTSNSFHLGVLGEYEVTPLWVYLVGCTLLFCIIFVLVVILPCMERFGAILVRRSAHGDVVMQKTNLIMCAFKLSLLIPI